jgi:hypothetical protein
LTWLGGSPYFSGLHVNGKAIQADQFLGKELVIPQLGEASIATNTVPSPLQHSGRLQSILTTDGTIQLLIPESDEHALSIALRIAHDLDTYHKLDAAIATYADAQNHEALGSGNIILIGSPGAPFVRQILENGRTPVSVTREPPFTVTVNKQSWDEPSLG